MNVLQETRLHSAGIAKNEKEFFEALRRRVRTRRPRLSVCWPPCPARRTAAAPWAPGCAAVMIANMPALNNSSKLMCSFGGVISINFAGQATVNIP